MQTTKHTSSDLNPGQGDGTQKTRPLEQETELLSRLRPSGEPHSLDDLQTTLQLLESVARAVLRGELGSLTDAPRIVKALKYHQWFRLGRTLLGKIVGEVEETAPTLMPQEIWLRQQWALCTYKDEELAPRSRFSRALAILETIGLRDGAKVKHAADTLPETLALGGAVYKRRWDHGRRLDDLHLALFFYRAAWDQNYRIDLGYGGVNAAFVLDLLAREADRTKGRAGGIKISAADLPDYAKKARTLRRRIGDRLTQLAAQTEYACLEKKDWFHATLAEVHFGLGDFPAARARLHSYIGADPAEWQRESTFRQIRTLAFLHGYDLRDPEGARSVLAAMLPKGLDQAMTPYNGKIGLALSGGGFRASFYHLGVMARMAEVGILPSVEVLSTVSGGSIVGALYYLELRKMLQESPDESLKTKDYVRLVHRVQQKFLAGVEKNLRVRVLAGVRDNFRMLIKKFNRSRGLGRLYEEFIYQQVEDEHQGRSRPLRPMDSLTIEAAGSAEGEGDQVRSHRSFHPKLDNWRRAHKAPVLLLNATSLNSGHNWCFTASWMGEPPRGIEDGVDRNRRYRRLYYAQAPTGELKKYPLGYAVAASSCVPMLFEPLEIAGLYAAPEEQGADEATPVQAHTVQLVDGGVHDNQGLQGLLGEACNVVLCSDASGQMNDDSNPKDNLLAVGLRTMSVQGDRIREAQYQDVDDRAESAALDGLFFVHLKQGVDAGAIDWVGCRDPSARVAAESETGYGVDKDLQRKLAAMRTDLDSFTEVEAYALMAGGYQVAKHQFQRLRDEEVSAGRIELWCNFDIDAQSNPDEPWAFADLIPIMRLAEDSGDPRRLELGRQLDAGTMLFGKIWKLDPALRMWGWVGLGLMLAMVIALVVVSWDQAILEGPVTIAHVILALVMALALSALPALRLLNPKKVARSWFIKIWLATVGAGLAKLHLRLFDPLFIKQGRLAQLLGKSDKT